jgi:hypothetical protein
MAILRLSWSAENSADRTALLGRVCQAVGSPDVTIPALPSSYAATAAGIVATQRPAHLVPGDIRGTGQITPDDTWDLDHGQLLEPETQVRWRGASGGVAGIQNGSASTASNGRTTSAPDSSSRTVL